MFRDELRKLMPHDEHARRLVAQTVSLDELLERDAPDWTPPRIERPALIHGHCHRGALSGPDFGRGLLARAGLDASTTNAGCCGMAGSFGFERAHYDLSVAIANLDLLPALKAEPEALVAAPGTSCRHQLRDLAERRALHPWEVREAQLG